VRDTLRAALVGAAFLVTVVLLPVFASACGGSALADPGLGRELMTAVPPASAPTETVSKSVATRSGTPSADLHERVMAERSRLAVSAAAVQSITPPPESGVEPAATVSVASTASTPPAEQDGATAAVLTDGQTPLVGVWSGTADRLASFLLGIEPEPCFTVSTVALAEHYVYYCADAGLRADVLWAQMIHETGYGAYGGDVWPEQNNYAGIGATGGGAAGMSFATAETGVMAHVAHMVAYVYQSSPVSWADANTDPRFDFVNPRGAAYVLADLNGRWAVPGTEYGQRIEDVVRAINGG